MRKVAVIDGGIFGCSCGIDLARSGFEVIVFERDSNILTGASTVNHLRHHYGFHYPRSRETVGEIKHARRSFESEYGDSLSESFPDFYGVSNKNSKTSPKEFLDFCDSLRLPYKIEWPEERFMDRARIGVCIRTPEKVYDPDILRAMIFQKIRTLPLELRLGHKVWGGKIVGKRKILEVSAGERQGEEEFDYLVNATYSNFNRFNLWFGFPRKNLQYELVELLELAIPCSPKIGLTIMDGEFSSLLPRGEKGTFTLGHVDASILRRVSGSDIDPNDITSGQKQSNRVEILRRGASDFPFLAEAIVLGSLYVTRVVKANVDSTDERPSEITEYGNQVYSIFGGKVITCFDIAKKLRRLIEKNETN